MAGRKVHSGFAKGSGSYKCGSCGRRTRDTGSGEAEVRLCFECFEIGGLENAISDHGEDWEGREQALAEVEQLTAQCRAKGGKL